MPFFEKGEVMNEITKITISGNEYPIRFDYMVLKDVAEKYKDVSKFEMDLLGVGKVKDDNGKEVFAKVKEPSIACIIFALPKMINSALDFLGFDAVDEKQIIREIDLNYIELAGIMHKEMSRCFKSSVVEKKKYNPNPIKN